MLFSGDGFTVAKQGMGRFFFAEICNLFRAMAKLPNPTNFLPNSLE
jgi:hypothetical protein